MADETHPIVLWINALRSGDYTQTQGRLYRAEDTTANEDEKSKVGYCCLGVACDVYHKETGNGEWESPDYMGDCKFAVGDESSDTGLVKAVDSWFDEFPIDSSALVSMNDSQEEPFDEIADELERKYSRLF